MSKNFLRRSWDRYSKLGKGRKKKQTWRRPTGRDNKMREKRRGYPKVVSIGYKTDKKYADKINGKETVFVNNKKDLEKVSKDKIVILGKMGLKKKLEIAKIAEDKKIGIFNLNAKKILRKNQRSKNKEMKNESKK